MNNVILVVCDGFGIAPPGPGNAVTLASPSNFNRFLQSFPNTTLKASGEAVGLPAGEVGNTEVGHINLGAGRIVYQDLPRINMSIADGTFYENTTLLNAVDHIKKTGGNLHIFGLISEGAVHSSLNHLYALLYFAKEQKLNNVFLHAITDGRDSPPKSAAEIIKQVEEEIAKNSICKIVSVMGRYYAMDRDRRWERTERAYNCITKGVGAKTSTAAEAIANAYASGKTDEFIEPTNVMGHESQPVTVKQGDAVIFFNFRIDRPRQLTKAFVLDDFENEANQTKSFDPYAIKYYKTHEAQVDEKITLTPPFKRGPKIENVYFVTMTEYEKNLPASIVFPPITVKLPLGRVLSENDINQLRMSESEKERFVTFYFNGQRENAFPQEERLIVPSPKVPTYDMQPEMSANQLTEILVQKMKARNHPFILVNFANADMVGHTGNIEASIKAVQTLDQCLGKLASTAIAEEYTMMITADHGNVEQKINPKTGQISTEHTDNPVPFVAISKAYEGKYIRLPSGILADVAPTILAVMGIPKPTTMSGRNLLEDIR